MSEWRFNLTFLRSLPEDLRPAARLLFDGSATPEENDLATRIEGFRDEIPLTTDLRELPSYSSPHSGTFHTTEDGHAVPGPFSVSSVEAHMKTGVGKRGGLFLRRIAQGRGCKRIVELGTNTGLSGSYFLSLPQVELLVTVEGSKELCEIADRNLMRVSHNYRLMNMLFDDAIDALQEEGYRFDCAYIDGQHEREATLHYLHRIRPLLDDSATIVFDDIYWSDDMNRGWQEICALPIFSSTIDFGSKGVCILNSADEPRKHYDICHYIGRPNIYRAGW